MGFFRQGYWSLYSFPSPGDLPNPGIEPRSPTLQADSLPAEPQGKPKNTGIGSLSLLQGTFPTQELNQGLLHCRQILYQLSYQGSPVDSLYACFVDGGGKASAFCTQSSTQIITSVKKLIVSSLFYCDTNWFWDICVAFLGRYVQDGVYLSFFQLEYPPQCKYFHHNTFTHTFQCRPFEKLYLTFQNCMWDCNIFPNV